MKLKGLIIGAIIIICVAIVVTIAMIIIGPKMNKKLEVSQENVIEDNKNTIEEDDEPLIAIIEKKEEMSEDPLYVKTAADITQELQEMDINIGTLKIPKINFNSEVYCKQDANKMEEVPCMLYTNQGINKPGVTILVGHNRGNWTLFSDINSLEENDEVYFKDYEGTEKKYTIYSKFVTDNDDVSFYNTPSAVPIIVMQCCLTPTTSDKVTIVMAKVE